SDKFDSLVWAKYRTNRPQCQEKRPPLSAAIPKVSILTSQFSITNPLSNRHRRLKLEGQRAVVVKVYLGKEHCPPRCEAVVFAKRRGVDDAVLVFSRIVLALDRKGVDVPRVLRREADGARVRIVSQLDRRRCLHRLIRHLVQKQN